MEESSKHSHQSQGQELVSVPTFKVLAGAIRQEKEIKGIQIRKEVKPSVFGDYIILYTRYPHPSTRELLEMKFINVA